MDDGRLKKVTAGLCCGRICLLYIKSRVPGRSLPVGVGGEIETVMEMGFICKP